LVGKYNRRQDITDFMMIADSTEETSVQRYFGEADLMHAYSTVGIPVEGAKIGHPVGSWKILSELVVMPIVHVLAVAVMIIDRILGEELSGSPESGSAPPTPGASSEMSGEGQWGSPFLSAME